MSKRSKGFHQPVIVEWVDSMKTGGWRDVPKEDDLRCASIGMLMESNKERVVVALNVSAYGYGDYMTIPRSAVRKVTKLKMEVK